MLYLWYQIRPMSFDLVSTEGHTHILSWRTNILRKRGCTYSIFSGTHNADEWYTRDPITQLLYSSKYDSNGCPMEKRLTGTRFLQPGIT